MNQELVQIFYLVLLMPFRGFIAILLYPLVILKSCFYIKINFNNKKKYGLIWRFFYFGVFGSTFMLILYVLSGKEIFDPFSEPTWISEPCVDIFEIFSITDLKRGSNWF